MSTTTNTSSGKLGLDGHGDLAIATIAYWIPATILALFVCFKQGFGRQSGWLFILLLGICRLIGSACTVAIEEVNDPQNWSSLNTAAAITGALGISFLLSAATGLQLRVMEHMSRDKIVKPLQARVIYLVITVAIILSIVGGIKVEDSGELPGSSNTNPSTSDYNLGFKLLKAALILLIIVWAVLVGLLAMTYSNLKYVLDTDRKLVYAETIAMPLIFVRILYGLLAAFQNNTTFNLFNADVWVEAFMQTLEEFIVAAIFIAVGMIVTSPKKIARKDAEMGGPQQTYPQQYPQQGYPPQQRY